MDDASKGKKIKGGRPKKKKAKGCSNKKKGRPFKQSMEEAMSVENEPCSDEDTLDFGFVEWSK